MDLALSIIKPKSDDQAGYRKAINAN